MAAVGGGFVRSAEWRRVRDFAAGVQTRTTPAVLAVVYAMILGSVALGGYVIWRGIPIDLDEKFNLNTMARASVVRLDRIAGRFNIRLPTRSILRRLDGSD